MTKLIADLKSVKNIDQYLVDGYILSSADFSTYNDYCFSIEEIKTVIDYAKKSGKEVILNIDRIIEEDEIEALYSYLEQVLKLDIDYFIYGDFAVLTYFKRLNLSHKLIYDPKTMITSYNEAIVHQDIKDLVAISNELTLEEILEVSKAKNTVMEVYGYHQMFYSRRPILSTFSLFQSKNQKLENHMLTIKEELRNDFYPIYQSSHGTYIYTNYRYANIKYLKELLDHLVMIRINSMFIDESEIIEVIKVYKKVMKNELDPDFSYQELLKINSNISDGFLHSKSILIKERES